jgi:hypothetical protein
MALWNLTYPTLELGTGLNFFLKKNLRTGTDPHIRKSDPKPSPNFINKENRNHNRSHTVF